MARTSFMVDVNPALLKWARESAGYNVADAASHSHLSAGELSAFESGRRKPTWMILKKLAATYRRPTAALLLPEPPKEASTLPDFRTLHGTAGRYSPELLFVIRNARWLATQAAELQAKLQAPLRTPLPQVDLRDDPETAARASRETLGVGLEEQASFGKPYKALNRWRDAVEAQNILVFQFPLSVSDARGFSIVEAGQAAIVLNQSDAPTARIFTLFHEYAHLRLRRPGVCTPEIGRTNGQQPVETFCNRFAAALLLPRTDLEARISEVPTDKFLRQLAQQYMVSRFVVLGRLQGLGRITSAQFQQFSHRWKAIDEAAKRPSQGGGGMSAAKRCLAERGKPLVSFVVEATKQELITFSDANTILGVKFKDFRMLAGGA